MASPLRSSFGPRVPGSVEMHGVVRSFGEAHVLRGCSLNASPGDIVAVYGRNGSGKTTLLRILAGVLAADDGWVTVCDAAPGRGWSCYVPAGDRMLHWRLTGEHDLRFFAALAGVGASVREAEISSAVEALDASDLRERTVGECSTGQRRRLMLAAAFVTGAPVVLLDEPYSDLDRRGRDAVAAACTAWTKAGGVVVYAAPEPGDGPTPSRGFGIAEGTLEPAVV
jgi:ABC-type multidrug transport system ATPase subunit